MSPVTDSADLFGVEAAFFDGLAPRVVAFRGAEAISEPYLFLIDVVLPHVGGFDPDAVVGERLTLASKPQEGQAGRHLWHGMIAGIELVQQEGEVALFEISMVPSLWRLGQSHHSRVFTEMTVPEIIEAVFSYNDLWSTPDKRDYRLAHNARYVKREHVCQYHESDLAFISRWMEREGIYYFFEHEEGESHERLVICDEKFSHEASRRGAIRYRPGTSHDMSTSGEAFRAFRSASRMQPRSVKLTDYDYLKPALAVEGAADAYSSGSALVVDHRANFLTPEEGRRLAEIRAQELMARQKVFSGHGRVMRVRSGYTFELEEHPSPRLNGEYLATSIRHHHWAGGQAWKAILDLPHDEEYRVEVVAIPESVPFRPERRTPQPRIDGVEIALVDGPKESVYAQIDAHGRYKVKIQFDESELTSGTASTWVRMLQPHGGAIEGFHFPLRKGTEVLLVFLGGDPDRPVIAGIAPNAVKPSPVIEANLTQNVIQTGSRNRIEIEDLEGKQYIDHATPPMNTFTHMGEPHAGHTHYFHKHTLGNELIQIGTDRNIEVGQDQTVTIGRDQTIEVGRDQIEHVVGDVNETYDKNHTLAIAIDETIDVGGDHTETIQGDSTLAIKGSETADITKDQTLTVGGNRTISTTGNHLETVTGTYTLNITAPATQTAEADWFTTVRGNSGSLTIGMTTNTFIGLRNLNMIGGSANTTIGNALSINMGLVQTFNLGVGTLTYTVGIETSVKLAASFDLKVAASFELSGGASFKYNKSIAVEYTGGLKFGVNAVADFSEKVFTVTNGQVAITNQQAFVQASRMHLFL